MSAEERKKSEHGTRPAPVVATAKSAASQRRHQLEHNSLAEQLNKVVQALKEGPSRTTWIVAGILLVAVALFFVWRHFSRASEEKNSGRWQQLQRLLDGELPSPGADENMPPPDLEAQLEKFAKDNEGTSQARLARFDIARINLARGQEQLGGTGRDSAVDRVRKAADLYEKLQGEASDVPILHQEALLEAGKARETLGEFDKAVENYGKLIKEFPNEKGPFFAQAQAGVDRLKVGTDSRKEAEALAVALTRKSAGGGP